jgi:hypothetical protein
VEKEIDLFQDGGQIKREKDIYHHVPKPISIICHLPDSPPFSLPTTFKGLKKIVSIRNLVDSPTRQVRESFFDYKYLRKFKAKIEQLEM